MKKVISLLISALLFCSAVSAKSIVIYFSKTGEQYAVGKITEGNTAKVAKEIAKQTSSDIFELKTVEVYPEGYQATTEVAMSELKKKARPELSVKIPDLKEYDTVYLGYPIWWGDLPMCVYTFLESVDLSGKTIKPFCTHEGSGASGTDSKIKNVQKNSTVTKVLAIRGKTAQTDSKAVETAVKEWIK